MGLSKEIKRKVTAPGSARGNGHALKNPTHRKKSAGNGHANGAKRNEAVLNLVAAHQASHQAAYTDADGKRGVQVAGLGLADV